MLHWILFGLSAILAPAADEARPADGALLSSAPCVRHPVSYDEDVAGTLRHYESEAAASAKLGIMLRPAAGLRAVHVSRAEYEASIAHPSACRRILYGSDGLRVVAYIWEPTNIPSGARLPVVIALHGGNRNEAKWTPDTARGMAPFVSAGFIVIGVQYRGVDGGEGQEEFGGADVHDVVNAVMLARRLPEADPRNIFMFGASRGGMELFLALRDGAVVNAAASISGMADIELEAKRHPDWEAQNWRPLIPNYDRDRAAALARRSAVAVAKQVDLPPMLILQGTADWRVDPRNAFEVAEALQARGRPYALHIFDGDVHGLTWNWRERDRLMIDWFRQHMVR
jgi:dipeptidyl aminopeptidase/acylaminoacyl peptidase